METNGKIEVTKKSKYISIGVFLPAGPKGEKLAKVQCENGKCTHVCEDLSPAYSKEYDEAGIFLEEEALVRDGDFHVPRNVPRVPTTTLESTGYASVQDSVRDGIRDRDLFFATTEIVVPI